MKRPLDESTRGLVLGLLPEIRETTQEAKSLDRFDRKELEEIAGSYDNATSGKLAGIVGGIIGAAGGFALTTFVGTTIVITGPAGLVLGAALGVLAMRGRTQLKVERETQKLRIALNEIEARVRQLPPDTPRSVRDALWEEYELQVRRYGQLTRTTNDNSPRLPPAP
jgi:hypothetical protein